MVPVLLQPAPAAGATHLTSQQLAARWSITTCSLLRWLRAREGFLKPVRVGRRMLWPLAEVVAYEEATRAPA